MKDFYLNGIVATKLIRRWLNVTGHGDSWS
jgi:hypothetical protein